nr:diacylglycerol kinase family protein [Anaerolineae bacterium]
MRPDQAAPKHQSATRVASFKHAFAGWAYLLKTQPNARIHAFFTLAAVIAGTALRIHLSGWLAVVVAIGLVWSAELINTALEAAIDLACPGPHPTAKAGKDLAAAAVLTTAITAVIIGLLVFGPPLLHLVWPVITRLVN